MTQLPGNGRWRSSTWILSWARPLKGIPTFWFAHTAQCSVHQGYVKWHTKSLDSHLFLLINVLFYSNIPCSCSWLALSWSHCWWCVSGKRLVPNPPFSSLWSDVGRLLMDPQDSLIFGCRSYHEGPASLMNHYKYFLGKYTLDPEVRDIEKRR